MRPLLVLLLAACMIPLTTSAWAADDCPPGSIYRSQDGYSFCEPTVCENDGQCNPTTEVCRPIALCMQVGTLDKKSATLGDAGSPRLVVTQRCAPDKSCPQTTVCSDKGRCVTKAVAEKMGILALTSAAPVSTTTPAEKKTCGCRAVGEGAGIGDVAFGAVLSAGTLVMALGRRRRTRAR